MIGASHNVCEDFASSLDGFAALADGCSVVTDRDGNKINAHTDIGARLLVRAAFHHRCELNVELQHNLILHTADGYRRQMDLPIETLSATLLTLRDEQKKIAATCCGDGLVAARCKTGNWVTNQVVYKFSPYYLRYQLLGRDCDYPCDYPTEYVCSGNDGVTMNCGSFVSRYGFRKDRYDLVIAMSDGSSSFTQHNRPIQFHREFTDKLLDFRRMKGRFVLRHLRGVMKELAQDGIIHQDDISMIAIHEED